jgi:hypothetical protein
MKKSNLGSVLLSVSIARLSMNCGHSTRSRRFSLGGAQFDSGYHGTVGIAYFPDDGDYVNALVQSADEAFL